MLLQQVDDAQVQLDLLRGMRAGLKGRRNVQQPDGWASLYAKLSQSANQQVRREAKLLALRFGDEAAIGSLHEVMLAADAPAEARKEALASLAELRVDGLPQHLHRLIEAGQLVGPALRALEAYSDPDTPKVVLAAYRSCNDAQRQDAITALAARPASALALLNAVEKGTVPAADISAFIARQLDALGDQRVSGKLRKVWGTIRRTSREKQAQLNKYKADLGPDKLEDADLVNGRIVFARTCMKCHRLYGEGGQIGPDLTGSNRANLDYVLENALDPSAVIGKDYRLTNFVTVDGRLISGMVVEEAPQTVTVQTVNQRVTLDRNDIELAKQSDVSMMPEGQLEKLKPHDVRDLVAYLATKDQVPLPEGVTLPVDEPLPVDAPSGQ